MYLIRVLSFIEDLRFNVRREYVPGCMGRGRGDLVATSRGYMASQGTFSSWLRFFNHYTIEPSHEKTSHLGFDQVQHNLTCTVTEAG